MLSRATVVPVAGKQRIRINTAQSWILPTIWICRCISCSSGGGGMILTLLWIDRSIDGLSLTKCCATSSTLFTAKAAWIDHNINIDDATTSNNITKQIMELLSVHIPHTQNLDRIIYSELVKTNCADGVDEDPMNNSNRTTTTIVLKDQSPPPYHYYHCICCTHIGHWSNNATSNYNKMRIYSFWMDGSK